MPEIRRAHDHDRDGILDLWITSGLGKMSDDEWNAIIATPSTSVLVADDGGAIVGAAIASFDGWRAYIYHVAVAPAHRHRGLAKALMTEAEEHVAREGAARVYVMVHDENTAGLALSTVLGYVPEGDIALVKDLPGGPSAATAGPAG